MYVVSFIVILFVSGIFCNKYYLNEREKIKVERYCRF